MEIPNWYRDALDRYHRRTTGCLPHNIGMTIDQVIEKVSKMTGDEVEQWNEEVTDNMQTYCSFPMIIIGPTKDGQLAFYGINSIRALPQTKLEEIAAATDIEDKYGMHTTFKRSLALYKNDSLEAIYRLPAVEQK